MYLRNNLGKHVDNTACVSDILCGFPSFHECKMGALVIDTDRVFVKFLKHFYSLLIKK